MKALVVEQDFASRVILQKMIARYCETHIAVDGSEAIEAIRIACDSHRPYDLICLDTTMPELDGKAVLEEIRNLEARRNTNGSQAAKVIMLTAAAEQDTAARTFQGQCEAYLVKPVDRMRLLAHLHAFGIVT